MQEIYMEPQDFKTQLRQLGRKVRDARAKLGYSQESFAHACGLDRTYIGGVERGERNLGFKNLLRISKALKLEPSELLTGISIKCRGN